MKDKKDLLPYYTTNQVNVGTYRGPGIGATYGIKKGGFSDNIVKKAPLPNMGIPRKMN